MSSELRKSLESIQSLLSQSAATGSPMTASRLYPPSDNHAATMNSNTNNDYMTLHSPSLSTVNNTYGESSGLLLSPSTPATQVTLPSAMPGGSRYVPSAAGEQEEEGRYTAHRNDTSQQHHRSNAHGRTSSDTNNTGEGRHYNSSSERSSSICNFANSTPYQITAGAASSAFSSGGSAVEIGSAPSGGGGAVIGSPLSAFSAVNHSGGKDKMNNVSRFAWNDSQKQHQKHQQQQMRSSANSGLDRSSHGGGRETMSLLVSPPTARLVDDGTVATSTTVVNSAAKAATVVATPKENDRRRHVTNENGGEVINPNPNAKDPTPYHYRGNPPAKDYSVRSSQQYHHGGRSHQQHHHQREEYHNHHSSSNTSASTSSSRSIDPPAKSPFGSIIPASGGGGGSGGHYRTQHHHHYHQQQSTPNHNHHSHPITELSIIEEDENNFHDHLNQSHTSTVTGFTLPRTPVLRDIPNNTTTSTSLNHSGGGRTAANRTSGSVVGFATNNNNHPSTPGATSSIKSSFLGGGGGPPSTDKLLRRPSAAMRDSFQQLASQTAHQLEDIWDIVGIVPEERASQLADLVDRIAALCHEKIDQEEQLADQFRKEIASARAEWEESCAVLRIEEEDPLVKMKRDPSVNGATTGVSLQSEYEVMMGRLESIRGRMEVATEDIVNSQQRIYEAYAALNGCSVDEARDCGELEAWADTKTNLTEEQLELFRSKAVELEESVSSRTQAVVSLLVDCQTLIRELGIVPPGCEGEAESDGYIEVGQNEDDVKIMNSLKSIERSNDNDGRPRSRGKSTDSYTVASLFESSSCIGIGKDALDHLTSRIAELNGEKRRRREKLAEIGGEIASLWSMLRVPSAEQHAFTKSVRGLGMDTMDKGEKELNRLHELKTVMIGKLIREQRQTIDELWERTNASKKEKASFDRYFHVNDEDKLTSELLAKHEEYAGALTAKLEKMQPILELIERRESIIEERVELEMLQKDPDRLKGRNASKQLMKEEKMMRRVQKELPKITQHLEKKLKEWYVTNKPSQTDDDDVRDEDLGHFMYKGQPYLRTMKTQEHEWVTRKERGEKERQRKRQEERSTSSGSAFGSAYSKLPGKKWNPPPGDRPRSASNMRPGSRGLRPGDMNRVNRPGEKSIKPGMTSKSSGYGARAVSAPRARF